MNIDSLNKEIRKQYRRALVTGGAGFVGSHLCEELVKSGIEVVALDDFSAGYLSNVKFLEHYPNFKVVKCDITDMTELQDCFKEVDLVFHNAASKKSVCLKDPRRDLEVNAKGAFNLLELSQKFGVKKFVHASTGSVYGEPVQFPQTEAHPLKPVSHYGVSKLAGERYVALFNHLYNLNTTILRYFHVYGPRQESNEFGGVVSIFIRNLLKNQQPVIFGDGSQERSFTYVKDVVKANLLVAVDQRANGEVYNCASGISVTIQQLCDAILEAFGKKGTVSPKYGDWLLGDIKHFEVNSEKIQTLGLTFEKDFFSRLKEVVQETIQPATFSKNSEIVTQV